MSRSHSLHSRTSRAPTLVPASSRSHSHNPHRHHHNHNLHQKAAHDVGPTLHFHSRASTTSSSPRTHRSPPHYPRPRHTAPSPRSLSAVQPQSMTSPASASSSASPSSSSFSSSSLYPPLPPARPPTAAPTTTTITSTSTATAAPHTVSVSTPPAACPVGICSTNGRPTYQHDRAIVHHAPAVSLYAVADGHGDAEHGHLVAHHLHHHLAPALAAAGLLSRPLPPDLRAAANAAVAQLDAAAIRATAARRVYAGSTLCAVLRTGPDRDRDRDRESDSVSDRDDSDDECDGFVHCINVGDSRAVLVSLSALRRATALSRDHVCTDAAERARVERAGGVVLGGLLNGYISMTRALGDDDLKAHRDLTAFPVPGRRPYGRDLFTAEADVTTTRLTADDVAVVVATDGVWGRLSNDAVAAIVVQELHRAGGTPDTAARAIVKRALAKGSPDNITAVVALTESADVVRGRIAASSASSRRRFRAVTAALRGGSNQSPRYTAPSSGAATGPGAGAGTDSDAAADQDTSNGTAPMSSSASVNTASESSSTVDSAAPDAADPGRPERRLRIGRRRRRDGSELGVSALFGRGRLRNKGTDD